MFFLKYFEKQIMSFAKAEKYSSKIYYENIKWMVVAVVVLNTQKL